MGIKLTIKENIPKYIYIYISILYVICIYIYILNSHMYTYAKILARITIQTHPCLTQHKHITKQLKKGFMMIPISSWHFLWYDCNCGEGTAADNSWLLDEPTTSEKTFSFERCWWRTSLKSYWKQVFEAMLRFLVGGLVAIFIVPLILGCDYHPNWRTHIFQRGGEKPPTSHENPTYYPAYYPVWFLSYTMIPTLSMMVSFRQIHPAWCRRNRCIITSVAQTSSLRLGVTSRVVGDAGNAWDADPNNIYGLWFAYITDFKLITYLNGIVYQHLPSKLGRCHPNHRKKYELMMALELVASGKLKPEPQGH